MDEQNAQTTDYRILSADGVDLREHDGPLFYISSWQVKQVDQWSAVRQRLYDQQKRPFTKGYVSADYANGQSPTGYFTSLGTATRELCKQHMDAMQAAMNRAVATV